MIEVAVRMTLSLFRLSRPHPIAEVHPRRIPAGACYWSLRPDNLTSEGAVSHAASVFCTVGLFALESDAVRAFDARADLTPDAPDIVDTLHLLLRPIVHRGSLNWLDRANPGAVFRPEAREEDTGTVLSMTTAGYAPAHASPAARVARFITNTVAVGVEMEGANGLLFRQLFGPDESLGDAITISVWKSAANLTHFAYGTGSHRERMVAHAASPFFDRASFSRFAIERAAGTWEGVSALHLVNSGCQV